MLIHKSLLLTICLCTGIGASAEPIFYETHYPKQNTNQAPAVLALHSSGGYASIRSKVNPFVAAGYVVYTPDFFKKHGITTATRFETWTVYRTAIEQELGEIVQVMQHDPRIDSKNIFAVGYSNGGYWAAYLAAKGIVNAGASHYGVWDFPGNASGYPANYFSSVSHPVLALVGSADQTQKFNFVSPQIEKAQKLSPLLQMHTYNAGHGWDCVICKGEYVRDETATTDALNRTLDFFKSNTQK